MNCVPICTYRYLRANSTPRFHIAERSHVLCTNSVFTFTQLHVHANPTHHRYHFVERSYGKTTRSIRLPETADVSKANADYSSGVLTLTFPKREVPAARRIRIPVGDGSQPADGDGKVSITEGGGTT